MAARRQARRDADRGGKLGRARRREGGTGGDRQHHRTHGHAGHPPESLERAVLQRAQGARPLRLFHHQRPSRFDSERAGGRAGIRQGHGQGPEISLRQSERSGRDRQEAISHHGARGPQGDARPVVQGPDVEQGRLDQQGSLGHRQRGGARGRHPQDRREVRGDHRHELRRKRAREPVRGSGRATQPKTETGKSNIMSEPIWNKFLTERDKAVFESSGYGARGGFGKRPALLIIDVNYAFCDERPMPILESIKRWRNSCGEDAWVAMPYLKALIDKAHAKGIPVIYTTGVRREDNWDSESWTWKNGRSDEDMTSKPATNVDGNDIVAEIAPAPQDIVVLKEKPSGFFGTNMASYLTLLGCDSVIVTGTTTSGCVRATVLDAFSLNYRIALAEEGCFDRSQASHAINLCDMNAKYADVVKTSEVLEFFDTMPPGQYDLPKGAPVEKHPSKR